MSDRWVCKRCFTDNEASALSCGRCGLARGSEVTAADRDAWAAETGAPRHGAEPAGWKRWLRFWWVPAIGIALAVGWFTAARRGDDGALTSAGTVSVDELRAGDCFNAGPEEEISEVDGVPCDEPHAYEVFEVATFGGEAYPARDDALQAVFVQLCVPPFQTYVGTPYETSALYASFVTPTLEGWRDGDRVFICYLFEEDESMVSESMAGSGR